MIVAPMFSGDDDLAFIGQQHDSYGEALSIIVFTSLDYFVRSARVLREKNAEIIEKIDQRRGGFDHRTVQDCHDLMAAYWRWKFKRQEPSLLGMEPVTIENWLQWTRKEVAEWFWDSPEIIQYVTYSVAFQNEERGYKAEEELSMALKLRYSEMFK